MAIVRKKVPPEFYNLISSGVKKFELRLNDFKINEGDILILEEWDAHKKKYTGRTLRKKAGYILEFPLDKFGQKELINKYGLVVIQLE